MYRPPFEIVFTDERLITPSGLGIVCGMLGKSDFVKQCNRIPVDKKRSEPQIKDGDILLSYIGILCQGKTDYDSVNEMSLILYLRKWNKYLTNNKVFPNLLI